MYIGEDVSSGMALSAGLGHECGANFWFSAYKLFMCIPDAPIRFARVSGSERSELVFLKRTHPLALDRRAMTSERSVNRWLNDR